jgi:predicted permease
MSWFSRFRRPSDDEFAREVAAHLALETEERVARGEDPDEARHAATRTFGNAVAVRERHHERSPWFPLESLWGDVRHGWRVLWRAPVVTIVALASLALGVGANTAIFTLVRATILQPLAVPEPHRVFGIYRVPPGGGAGAAARATFQGSFRHVEYRRFRDDAADVMQVGAIGSWAFPVEARGHTQIRGVSLVSHEFFEVLAVKPLMGRWPTAGEERDAAPVAVLSEGYWRGHVDSDPDVVGTSIRVRGRSFTVVGVAPDALRLSAARVAEGIFVPLTLMPVLAGDMPFDYLDSGAPQFKGMTAWSWLRLVARLRPEVAPSPAEARLRTIDPTIEGLGMRAGARSVPVSLVPLRDAAVPFESRPALVRFLGLLAATAALVLLVGCASLATVLLARAEERRREMAVRATLGAGRRRLVRQLLVEATLLAAAGGLAGLAAAHLLLHLLSTFSLPGRLPVEALDLAPDLRVLGFAIALSALTTLACGVAPAWHGTRVDLVRALKAVGTANGSGRSPARALLLGAQVALATVLLVAAGLFVRSVQRGLTADVGFDVQNLVTLPFTLEPERHGVAQRLELSRALVERVRRTPGVAAAAFGPAPFFPGNWQGGQVTVDGERFDLRDERIQVVYVDPQYRAVVGLPLLEGRDFTERDVDRATTALLARQPAASGPASATPGPVDRVALVNEPFARRLVRGPTAVGRRFTPFSRFGDEVDPTVEIIGVVGRARFDDLRQAESPAVYLLRESSALTHAGTILVRTSGPPQAVLEPLAREVRALLPQEPLTPPRVVADDLAGMLLPERLGATLLGWFSTLAFVLAALGTYGVVAYAVARRRLEVGIRLALGARPRDIVAHLARVGVVPVAGGLLVGTVAAWNTTHLARQFLFEVSPRDALAFVASAALLLVAGVVASLLPARRATKIDPATALRAE